MSFNVIVVVTVNNNILILGLSVFGVNVCHVRRPMYEYTYNSENRIHRIRMLEFCIFVYYFMK